MERKERLIALQKHIDSEVAKIQKLKDLHFDLNVSLDGKALRRLLDDCLVYFVVFVFMLKSVTY